MPSAIWPPTGAAAAAARCRSACCGTAGLLPPLSTAPGFRCSHASRCCWISVSGIISTRRSAQAELHLQAQLQLTHLARGVLAHHDALALSDRMSITACCRGRSVALRSTWQAARALQRALQFAGQGRLAGAAMYSDENENSGTPRRRKPQPASTAAGTSPEQVRLCMLTPPR